MNEKREKYGFSWISYIPEEEKTQASEAKNVPLVFLRLPWLSDS